MAHAWRTPKGTTQIPAERVRAYIIRRASILPRGMHELADETGLDRGRLNQLRTGITRYVELETTVDKLIAADPETTLEDFLTVDERDELRADGQRAA